MKIKFILLLLIVLPFGTKVSAQNNPSLSENDRIRLAEAFRLDKKLGEKLWKGWSKVPFAVLLVTSDYEFLIRHQKPSKDFSFAGFDPLLKEDVYFRKRINPTNLLATFPAVGGITTVVVGQAENTDSKTSSPWVITLIHEHFHQLQQSQPNASEDLIALNINRGDQTGMWMLNYAFPYDSPEIGKLIANLSRVLADTLKTQDKAVFAEKFKSYRLLRQQLKNILSPDDYKYISLQLWTEGIARYTEYRIAELAATKYKPSEKFISLPDYTEFGKVAQKIKNNIMDNLKTLRLEKYQRVAFYPIGGGEGLLLDRINPKWHNLYFKDKFYLEKYFKTNETKSATD